RSGGASPRGRRGGGGSSWWGPSGGRASFVRGRARGSGAWRRLGWEAVVTGPHGEGVAGRVGQTASIGFSGVERTPNSVARAQGAAKVGAAGNGKKANPRIVTGGR